MSAPGEHPRRGEIWRYKPVITREGRSDLRLIVSADAVNAGPMVTVYAVDLATDAPADLLTVPVSTELGQAVTTTLGGVLRRRLTEHVDTASPAVMEQIDVALRALLEL